MRVCGGTKGFFTVGGVSSRRTALVLGAVIGGQTRIRVERTWNYCFVLFPHSRTLRAMITDARISADFFILILSNAGANQGARVPPWMMSVVRAPKFHEVFVMPFCRALASFILSHSFLLNVISHSNPLFFCAHSSSVYCLVKEPFCFRHLYPTTRPQSHPPVAGISPPPARRPLLAY